jgi:undecaprenyl-diphosphatase
MRFHIFKKYELFVLILNLISMYVLAKTIQDAWSPHSFMANFDVYVSEFMNTFNHAHLILTKIAGWVTTIGGMAMTTGLGIIIAIWFVVRKKWRSAAIMFLAIGSTGLFLGVLKEFFMRARPDNALIQIANDPSFPSGHAGMAAALFVIVAYLLVRRMHSVVIRELVIVGCVLATFAIGLSRVVLNVHWVSDVIAGWSLGIFMATASILLVRYVSVLVVKKS